MPKYLRHCKIILKHNVTVWGDINGTEKLRIGELAKLTNVTKRTIDYYTSIGLLKAERSASNYRYYGIDSIEKLCFIEQCKKKQMTLDEIKQLLHEEKEDSRDLEELLVKMQGLEKDVSEIVTLIKDRKINKDEFVKKHLSHESVSLIQSLLLLIM